MVLILFAVFCVFFLIFAGLWWWSDYARVIPGQIKEKVQTIVPKTVDYLPAFKLWIENNLEDEPELKAWLLGLSDDGLGALTVRVAAFAADLNIQMEWLLGNAMDIAPGLKATCQSIIVNYLDVCRFGIAEQGDITIFDTYNKLITLNGDARFLNLRNAVFARLIREGLVDAIPAYDMIMASELQRQEMASAAIRLHAASNWDGFVKILAESAREVNAPKQA
ncbi:MAG: hypothetical protein ACR2HF_05390 [Methylococcaceae bacterium]